MKLSYAVIIGIIVATTITPLVTLAGPNPRCHGGKTICTRLGCHTTRIICTRGEVPSFQPTMPNLSTWSQPVTPTWTIPSFWQPPVNKGVIMPCITPSTQPNSGINALSICPYTIPECTDQYNDHLACLVKNCNSTRLNCSERHPCSNEDFDLAYRPKPIISGCVHDFWACGDAEAKRYDFCALQCPKPDPGCVRKC